MRGATRTRNGARDRCTVIEPAAGGIASLTIYAGPLAAGLFAAFGLPPMVQESWSEPEA